MPAPCRCYEQVGGLVRNLASGEHSRPKAPSECTMRPLPKNEPQACAGRASTLVARWRASGRTMPGVGTTAHLRCVWTTWTASIRRSRRLSGGGSACRAHGPSRWSSRAENRRTPLALAVVPHMSATSGGSLRGSACGPWSATAPRRMAATKPCRASRRLLRCEPRQAGSVLLRTALQRLPEVLRAPQEV